MIILSEDARDGTVSVCFSSKSEKRHIRLAVEMICHAILQGMQVKRIKLHLGSSEESHRQAKQIWFTEIFTEQAQLLHISLKDVGLSCSSPETKTTTLSLKTQDRQLSRTSSPDGAAALSGVSLPVS